MKSCVLVTANFVKTGGTDGANYSLADHPVDRGVVETHLVAYNRYEAYGLAVREALCCGLPTFVTHDAGIAEQYPPSLQPLLVKDANDDLDLAERLKAWPARPGIFRSEQAALAANLRAHTWADLAAEFAGTVQNRR